MKILIANKKDLENQVLATLLIEETSQQTIKHFNSKRIWRHCLHIVVIQERQQVDSEYRFAMQNVYIMRIIPMSILANKSILAYKH